MVQAPQAQPEPQVQPPVVVAAPVAAVNAAAPPAANEPAANQAAAATGTAGVRFSLTPGLLKPGVLDYDSKQGISHYNNAIKKLQEELYDGGPDGFFQFLKAIAERANEFGWDVPGGIFWYVPSLNEPPVNILENYGRLNIQKIYMDAQAWMFSQGRMAQDDRMLYECIQNSLTVGAKAKLNVHRRAYTFMQGDLRIPCGVAYLKLLIRESYLDTHATTGMIRMKLGNLAAQMSVLGNDISKFNAYVYTMVEALYARGEKTEDLLTNLFQGYAACTDTTFVNYIADKQTEWEEGVDMKPVHLMNLALTKYKILKEKEIWMTPTKEQETLIALAARFNTLKKKYDGRAAEGTTKKKGAVSTKKGKFPERPDWMAKSIEPTGDALRKSKTHNGKPWYWCGPTTGGKCGGVWRCHKPEECKGTASKATGKRPANDQGGGGGKKGNQVVINAVQVASMQDSNDLTGGYQSN